MKPITIVGGGLAGLALGLGLRRRGVPVTIFEAGRYPRHRVCGEFISGRGQRSLARLDLEMLLLEAGARPAQTAAFFSTRHSSAPRPLPEPALCLSRHTMDALLADRFRVAGGDLKENCRWRAPFGDGVVRAAGRRPQAVAHGWRFFGLKAHARQVELSADLEMHFGRAGYVGLCRLNGAVNVCGLFRTKTTAGDLRENWRGWLQGAEHSVLHGRLRGADFDETSLSVVAGLSLRPQQASALPECCVGDAVTMIPPVTGNGMSMAFESAELALAPLESYSRGRMSWSAARGQIAAECDRRFSRRLFWSRWLQAALFHAAVMTFLLRVPSGRAGLWPFLFWQTR